MSKTKLASAFAALALVVTPGVALAHGNGHHHGKHHGKKHHRVLKTRMVVRPAASTTTPSSTTAPGAAVTASVKSFDASTGDLTIALSNGKEYTASVTRRTEIDCEAGAVPMARASHNGDDGDDDGDRSGPGNSDVNHGDGDHNDDGHADNGQVKDDDDDDQGEDQSCGTDALTAGTQVTEAKLVIGGPSGALWKELTLVK
jgi:hypothetical protein